MKVLTINTYRFDELSDNAKDEAREWYREGQEIVWGDEWIESLNVFCKHFDVKLNNWSYSLYDCPTIDYTVSNPDELFENTVDLSGNCPFTGYCGDESLLDPLRKDTEGKDRQTVIDECIDSWVDDLYSDIKHQLSDEYIDENIVINEYDFDINGNRI